MLLRRYDSQAVSVNPQAIAYLSRSRLPYLAEQRLTRRTRLSELPAMGYVRSIGKQPSPGRMSAPDVLRFLTDHDPADYCVVNFLRSTYGAICIRKGSLIYVEIVYGHLSGLLRYGAFQERFIFNADADSFELCHIQKIHQSHFVDPDTLHLRQIAPRPTSQQETARLLARLIVDSMLPDNFFSEVLVTDGGPIWIDAKPYPFSILFHGLFSKARQCVYSRTGDIAYARTLPIFEPRTWTPDHVPPRPAFTAIALREAGLGSHLVTYALERGLGAIYNK